MKKYWLAPLLGVALLSSCDKPAQKLDLTLSGRAEIQADGKVVIGGDSNLPDQTKLLVTVKRDGYSAQDTPTVQGGHFMTQAFSLRGSPLPAGHYLAEITMPIPAVQPESVQKVIGSKGENLTGTLLQQDSIGITAERVIDFEVQ